MNKLNLIGRTFGRWKVLSESLDRKRGRVYWNCKCSCGVIKEVCGSSLTNGDSTSCSCYRIEFRRLNPERGYRLRPYEAAFHALQRSCAARRIVCELTYEQFLKYSKVYFCFYCGEEINWYRFNAAKNGQRYNLDRKESDLPYSKSNCVVCCKTCNYMKSSMSYKKFLRHVQKISDQVLARIK